MDGQEKLPGGLFESLKQLQIFKYNFKIAMHRRSCWRQVLHIVRLKCTPEEKMAAKKSDDNKTDGPALLYHLLPQYTGTAESGIRTYQLSLNNLPEKLIKINVDVNKLCN
eukprot:7740049-Ditylum_brightwellii.AAC.1